MPHDGLLVGVDLVPTPGETNGEPTPRFSSQRWGSPQTVGEAGMGGLMLSPNPNPNPNGSGKGRPHVEFECLIRLQHFMVFIDHPGQLLLPIPPQVGRVLHRAGG